MWRGQRSHDVGNPYSSPCRLKGKEAHPGLDQPFDEAVVLLDQIIEMFDLPQFDPLGKQASGFELCNGFGIGRILVDIDHARSRRGGVGVSRSALLGYLLLDRTSLRSRTSRGSQRFEEEAFGGLGIARRAQEKLQGVAFRVDGPVEVHPGFFDFDVRLVHFPRVVACFQMRPTALFEFWGIALHPAVDGAMIDPESAFRHHLFHIAIAERVPQIPAHTQQDDLSLEMTPLERTLLLHEGNSSACLE